MAQEISKAPFAILHIPHSSIEIPVEVHQNLILTNEELEEELLSMTDRYTDELFSLDSRTANQVVFRYSRLVVDPERFVDDAVESMLEIGMGVINSRTSDGMVLREDISKEERSLLICKYYV